MKILLISSYIFGYMDFAVEEMKRQGHEVEVLYYEDAPLKFEYKNIFHKISAGIGKLFGENAKKKAREKALKKTLSNKAFDYTLIIHGQYLNQETHVFLKSISKKYVAYFFDSLAKMPQQKTIAPHFDKVFSYEPIDCEVEGYQFITNFIPSTNYKSSEYDYTVFNVGGIDERYSKIQQLASYLKNHNISFKFMLFNQKKFDNFQQIKEKLTVHEVLPYIKSCKIMLDIQRPIQNGLTFRVFEAIGNEKKLITTNKDIVNYEFYHPQNILLLDWDKMHIPKEFFEVDYVPVSDEFVTPYKVENWVKKVLYTK
ncbi:glycosyltransferase family 4 protein [Weeksellaceae bacterium KMM 9713]|uniref:Glycosyltransferase family 4 protein n=1 Tax=Profundicola chukchiensis TaxID=2961959 RepID=A0A9X4RVC1_9FLAO|nr:hypothetical protein [Profundicola chukchiensis]MDG4947023.1 glycosyltransferase family 4 protein [Profundicola chukchiensis]MDG4949367.1 glycosyltransferase family 4 protein [Profundicola chukchiensis]